MEADVALHAPEKWASGGDPRSDKIKYVYSNRRKEREAKSARKASRLQQIKPSRSYDNEMESSVETEASLSQPPPLPKTKDDSSMRYGEQSSSHQQGRSREGGHSGIPTPTGSPYTSRKNPHMLIQGGNSDMRWKAKDRKYPPRERRKNSGGESPKAAEKGNGSSDSFGSRTPTAQTKSHKQSKSGELKMPSRLGIPTPQGIVLEVKDGPCIRYKPSETMLSDVTELESYGDADSHPSSNEFSHPLVSETPTNPSSSFEHSDPGVSRISHSGPDPDDRPLPTLLKTTTNPESSDQFVFHNVAEASQRRYGVKHDDIVVGPAAARKQFNASPVSDEAAFSSVSLAVQQKAGIRHDDIVVGPNAKKQKAAAANQQTGSKLPPVSHVDCRVAPGVMTNPSSEDNHAHHLQQSSPDSGCYSGISGQFSLKDTTAGSTLERESRIPKPAERVSDTEQKQRGASPGTGIPVFRRDRSMDKSQDSLRGAAHIAVFDATSTRHQNKTPVTLEEDARADKSYGSVDRAKWRPKPGKSGLHRMKRGAKREANVSTESGYATDQMPSNESYESKISPQRSGGSDLRERFQRIGGSCNDIDKDLEEMVLDSRQVCDNDDVKISSPSSHGGHKGVYSKSRSKSTHNTPVKKQGVEKGSIPVPENLRKTTANSSNLQPDSRLHNSQSISSQQASQSSLLSPREGPNLKHGHQTSFKHPPKGPKALTPSTHPPPSPASSSASLSLSSTKPSPKPQMLPQPSQNKSSSITASTTNVADSTTTVPIKPRLHRSAEHLVGVNQLSVFQSADNVQHNVQLDSASDVSSTTSSTKTSKSVPEYSRQNKKNSSSSTSRKRVEALATPKRSSVAAKGRSVSLLRRESERSVVIVRRGSDRAITVSRYDPSVQDLKAATSHKELCQSMASLLNIDNEKAAEMLSTSLSKRRDLVEGLDADAILDYLTHHGVLDPSILVNLEGQGGGDPAAAIQRNSAILKHVEEHGDTAVALFINALRQSGQLHLASSLDTEQRIKPMSGKGYLDKPRHKGEIVVRLSVEALKILAPREPANERNVNLSLLSSPSQERNLDFVDSDDDQVKPRSCWCFCVSRKRRTRSSSSKKEKRKNNKYEDPRISYRKEDSQQFEAPTTQQFYRDVVDFHDSNTMPCHRFMSSENDTTANNADITSNSNGSKTSTSFSSPPPPPSSASIGSSSDKTGKEKRKKKSKVKSSGKQPHVPPGYVEETSGVSSPIPEVEFHSAHQDRSSSNKVKSKKSSKQQKDSKPKQIPRNLNLSSSTSPPRTKDSDGIFMEYDPQLELVKLRACHDELASPTRQAGPVGIMVEQWKSSGKHFLVKSDLLCRSIVEEFLTDIIKYFEQDRGTLVLDVISEATSVTVFNICMTKNQVTKLERDHIDGSLLQKMQEVVMSRLDVSKFDIRGVRFCTEVDGSQIKSVLSEL